MYFPEKNDCCYCCDSAKGCGILVPNWLANATFVNTTNVGGVDMDVWNKQGLQPNYYFNIKSANIPFKID